jgi:hypothetical protein
LECDSSASLSSTPHRVRGHRGDLGDLLGGGIEIDVGVDQKHLTVRQHESVHRGIDARAGALADHPVV